MTTERHQKLREHATALGDLLVEKQTQYGDSVGSSGEILRQLYPNGIRPDQYGNLQLVVRVLDKLKRIASQGPDGTDRGGESPWRDVAGYGILGLAQAERSPETGRAAFMEAALPGMQATVNALLQSRRCGRCEACEIERNGCGCDDGAEDAGCFRCRPSKHARPSCPPVASCHGCQFLDATPERGGPFYCSKTNRPRVTARVEPHDPHPTWCPGREEQAR